MDMDKCCLHSIITKKGVEPFYLEGGKKPKIKQQKHRDKQIFIPRANFQPSSFITKPIGKGIKATIGVLKPDKAHLFDKTDANLRGSGIFDYLKKKAKSFVSGVKQVFSTNLSTYNNKTTKTLKDYGNKQIDSLMIYRTPINSMIDKALNILSLGKFEEAKKKYGFDTFFHLALVASVDGKNVIIEKNEVINVSTAYKTTDKTETMKIDMKGKKMTINELLDATRSKQSPQDFFSYDAFNNNCQIFIRALLQNVGLYDTDIDKFLFQDVGQLVSEMPTLAKVAKTATDIGAFFNKITGQGKKIMKGGFIQYILPAIDVATSAVDFFENLVNPPPPPIPRLPPTYKSGRPMRGRFRGGMEKPDDDEEEEPQGPDDEEEEQKEGEQKEEERKEGERKEGEPKRKKAQQPMSDDDKKKSEIIDLAIIGLKTLYRFKNDVEYFNKKGIIEDQFWYDKYYNIMKRVDRYINDIFKLVKQKTGLELNEELSKQNLQKEEEDDRRKANRPLIESEDINKLEKNVDEIVKRTIKAINSYKTDVVGGNQKAGFIKVMMANKNKKGSDRKNRKGQLLPNFDIDEVKTGVSKNLVDTKKNTATEHKKYFRFLSRLSPQGRGDFFDMVMKYYPINDELRDAMDEYTANQVAYLINREKEKARAVANRQKKREAREQARREAQEEKKEDN